MKSVLEGKIQQFFQIKSANQILNNRINFLKVVRGQLATGTSTVHPDKNKNPKTAYSGSQNTLKT